MLSNCNWLEYLRKLNTDHVLKMFKSLGNDYSIRYSIITVSVINPVAEYIACPSYITNNCIKTQTFPSQWKIAWICLIWKVRIRTETSVYRLIFVLPVLSKIIERIILQQMTILFKITYSPKSIYLPKASFNIDNSITI